MSSPEKIQIGPKKKIALVCSGGGSKAAAFHIGVALALREKGFGFYGGMHSADHPTRAPQKMDISTYVGSSAGSLVASFFAAGYSLDNILNSYINQGEEYQLAAGDLSPKVLPRLSYQKMFRIRPGLAREQLGQINIIRKIFSGLLEGNFESFLQLKWVKTQGLFSTAGVEQYLQEEVLPSNRFQDYLADLFIVATQLNHSRKVVFGKYSYQPPPHDLTCQYDNDVGISHACAASTSLPVIFAPYAITNKSNSKIYYIDGEVRDTLSTHVATDAGADLVIASYTHQPYHFVREIGSLTDHGLPALVVQAIYLLIEQKINNAIYSRKVQREAILAVDRFCREEGVSGEHHKQIIAILERVLYQRMDVDTIYIHPKADDSHAFFLEHFSLSPKKIHEIIRSGFRAASEVLAQYEFADRGEVSEVSSGSVDAG